MNENDQFERQQEVNRAVEAERLATHPMVQEGFKAVRKRLHEAMEATAPRNQEERERLYMALFAFKMFEEFFIDIMDTGDMAARQLNAFKTGKEPRKPFLKKGRDATKPSRFRRAS